MRLTYVVFVFLGPFWGSNFICMKWAAELITPAQITLLRVFFGFLPLAVVAFQKGLIRRGQLRHLPHFLVLAVLATAFYYIASGRQHRTRPIIPKSRTQYSSMKG